MKYRNRQRCFTYSVERREASPRFWIQPFGGSASGTLTGGEFGWGGTSVKK